MKSTGIVRKVDELGRIVLPKELRRTLNIDPRDALEIYVDGNMIILKKYEPACIFCGNAGDVIVYKDKNICNDCLRELKKQYSTTLTAELFGGFFVQDFRLPGQDEAAAAEKAWLQLFVDYIRYFEL